jgi:Chaperone of endosialidase
MRMQSGRAASAQAARGRQSFASAGGPRGGARAAMGGGARSMGGGGFRGGGGGGGFRGGGGGGRRSDLALKHDVKLLGHLDNGLGYYRFSYLGSDKAFVGVIAQEVQAVRPDAVWRARDGYLRVDYDKLGIKFRSYQEWLAGGAKIPAQGRI